MALTLIADKDLLDRQSLPSSCVKRVDGHTQSVGPLGKCFRFSAVFDHESRLVLSSVAGLLLNGGPAAIARFVVAIVIDSINLAFQAWSFAHVLKKPLKGLSPRIADGNASSAIVFISGCVWIFTPPNHRPPGMIFRGTGPAVTYAASAGNFGPKASAASLCASLYFIPEAGRLCKGVVSAVANALPYNQAVLIAASKGNNNKFSEPLPAKVNNSVVKLGEIKRLAIIDRSHRLFLGDKGTFWLGSNGVTALLRPVSLYHNLSRKGGTCGKS